MVEAQGYVLGQTERAARRLEIQDLHFAEASERLLDELALRPGDRVGEPGCVSTRLADNHSIELQGAPRIGAAHSAGAAVARASA